MQFEMGKRYVGTRGDYTVVLYPTTVDKGIFDKWACPYWYVEVKSGARYRRHGKPVGSPGITRHLAADGYGSDDLTWSIHDSDLYTLSPWKVVDRRSDCVYFMHAIGTDRVKIGWAAVLGARINTISAGCPFPIRILGTLSGRGEVEADIHAQFNHLRVHGEWFLLTSELVLFVQSRCADSVL